MGALIRPIDALLPRTASGFGGKARDLATLVRAGFPVPATFALSTAAADRFFSQVLPDELRPERLFRDGIADAARLEDARSRILEGELPADVHSALRHAYDSLMRAAASGVAVRSSSPTEDHVGGSAAGIHKSILNVQSERGLLDAVRQCWAAAFSPLALSYARGLGVEHAGVCGLLLQAMVPADVAGVLFTLNPLTGATDEIVVNACLGLGTVVTDGTVTPDTYRIDKRTGWLRDRVIGDKRVRARPRSGGGLELEALSNELSRAQSLDEHMLERLVVLGRRIEDHFGGPRDIEFAVAGDSIYVLQARAVTGLSLRRGTAARQRKRHKLGGDPSDVVWSNLNVGEALPGVATPLTWSVLSAFSELGFRQAFAALGCTVPKDAQLVGNFRGRIYLNLSELSAIGSQVPGLRPAAMLALGGGAEADRLERERRRIGSTGFLLRLPVTASRFVGSHLGFAARVEAFARSFEAERARIEGMDLRILSSASLDEMLSDVHRLLNETGGLMLTAYGGLLAALVPLRGALGVLRHTDAEAVLQRLLSAIEDVESAHPGRDILAVAAAFGRDAAARDAVLGEPGARSPAELPSGPARDAVDEFLRRHGHRGVREAELSEPRWREQPQILLDSVRVQLSYGLEGTELDLSRRVELAKAQAERELRAIPIAVRPAVRALVSVTRHYIKLRERLRGDVVRVLGWLRLVALDASRRLRVREPEIIEDAAFFLTLEDLHAWLRGELRHARATVQLRKGQYDRERNLPDPPDTFVGFPGLTGEACAAGSVLSGLAASPGIAEGRARVLRSPAEVAQLRPGEILVVPSADVGWAPVFVLAAGLVTDIGGPLSHACVVAREYGLPAVVNLRFGTRRISTGDLLRIDGERGLVELLDGGASRQGER